MKWLATTFGALAAAVLVGASVTGISDAVGWRFAIALTGGALGLICVLLAIGIMLRLLTSESFFLGQINDDRELKQQLSKYAADILPPELPTLDKFIKERDKARQIIRDENENFPSPRNSEDASELLVSLEPSVSRLVNLGHFEVLRNNFKRHERRLLAASVGAILGLGTFAAFSGPAKKSETGASSNVVQFAPGNTWADLARLYADVCGNETPLKAQLVGVPQTGWVELRLLSPDACAGIQISVPARVVVMPASPASAR